MGKLKPKTVTDIGSNMGGYAVLAAQSGASVTAFDTDEDSINMFYKLVKSRKLNILPLVMDVTSHPRQVVGEERSIYRQWIVLNLMAR